MATFTDTPHPFARSAQMTWPKWSLAEELGTRYGIHPKWEMIKDSGNAALARGELDEAIRCYSRALSLCFSPEPQLCALRRAAKLSPKGTGLHRVSEIDDLMLIVASYLPQV